ncbi:MAG: TonB-dependent receptor [Acidobacteriaceae bacterium]
MIGCLCPGAPAQIQQPAQHSPAIAPSDTGSIHGTVSTGKVPLPGVRVTATDTLTGKTYSAATDSTGGYSMNLPQNRRYILHAQFAVFAPAEKETLLSASSENQQVDFSLLLASRAAKQEEREQAVTRNEPRPYSGQGAESLNLMGSVSDVIAAAAGGGGNAATQLPEIAGNSDFSSESVAVSGQNGETNPFAGLDVDQIRKEIQEGQSESAITGTPQAASMRGLGGGMGGGGRLGAIFQNFKPNQPHGAFYWRGGNGALNAADFALRGQPITEPAYGQNQIGLTYMGAPYIPKLLTNDDQDFLFFALSTERESRPFDEYGTVPTADERAGNLSALTDQNGNPITIYDPTTGQPFTSNGQSNVIPSGRIAAPAAALLGYIPLPNLPGQLLNYQRLAAADTNTTKLGLRYNRSIGGSSGSPLMGMLQRYLGRSAPGQSINVNYNYLHTGADELNIFPNLDGKEQITQNSLQIGYSLGVGQITSKLSADWNRTNSQLTNRFTNTTNVASVAGLSNLPTNPMLYGLPDLVMNQFSNMSELQPNFQTQQTVSLSETSSWMHGKHNVKFGGDFRRVDFDLLGDTNSTGGYTFTGVFTEQPGTRSSGVSASGSSLADFLLGLPQETTIEAPYQKAYLRENVYDAYLQDDWRALPSLTVLAGLRYEYFSPYSELNDRLATLDTGNNFASVATVLPNGVGPFTGKYPRTLVNPERDDFAPRFGFAWNLGHDTVLRGGYGIDFTNGEYETFVQNLAFEPPYADVQTNETTNVAGALACSPICLADGFPAPQAEGNFAIDKNYRLPYIQVWNLNLQHTAPWNVVLNLGYSGSKGTRLDVVDAPGRTATGSLSGVLYDYEDSTAFSNYNGLTFSARKRLSNGIALQARYTYSHSIDDASSIGGNGGTAVVPAQNWQNLLAEESNSSFDIRHQAVGNFVYQLPFGPYAHRLTTGWAGNALSGISVSGTFDLASGEPLTPHYEATVADVARGSAGSLRPDRVPGVSLTDGGGSLDHWFNTAAYTDPANVYGTASRYSIPGPGTVSVDASLSKTIRFSETRTFEMRATANNVFNTVQYSSVDTTLGSASYGQVTGTAPMRQLSFMARFRY